MKDTKPKVWHLALIGLFSTATLGLADEKKDDDKSSAGSHEHMMRTPDGMEKCVGVVRKGTSNSCATDVHACAGMIPEDSPRDELGYYQNEWRWVKKGTCSQIQKSIADRRQQAKKSEAKK